MGAPRTTGRKLVPEFDRWFEVALGVVVSLVSLFPIGTVLAGFVFLPRERFDADHPLWLAVVVLLVSGGLAWWCVKTAYQLFTGHERAGGGLLSPMVLVLAGIAGVGLGVMMVVWYGVAGVYRSVECVLGGVGLFGLAQVRVQRRRRRRAA